ncbi:MAG TPA: hypothetical protein VJ750_03250 [Rhizomicrobium sp.]|nr:hypothetical protein [Rhizomicrobium sp.]
MTHNRFLNASFWLYASLSQLLAPVSGGDFLTVKLIQLGQFGPFDDLRGLSARMAIAAILWLVTDRWIKRHAELPTSHQ